jgi:hypothetical protein
MVGRPGGQSEGRRGARSAVEEGGRYLGIPQKPGQPAPPSVTINPVSTKSGAEHMLADLAFDLSNPTSNVYANEVLLVALGWKSYDTYLAEMNSLLS